MKNVSKLVVGMGLLSLLSDASLRDLRVLEILGTTKYGEPQCEGAVTS
jgi:hypothetical protein